QSSRSCKHDFDSLLAGINSSVASKLLEVEVKTASRLLLKAEKLGILKGTGKTKNKVYFKK
ncbi:MAG: hypothetical protein NC429_07220, partial [Lachnospiraceae bacterium]|nr:hypothetical protein [Lachnospiraceae bacterium]